MHDLRQRFGGLVKAHRVRLKLTQEELAERAGVSVDMISKIEGCTTGARFRVIENLASALDVDPAELFTTQLSGKSRPRKDEQAIGIRLASLSDSELSWLRGVIEAALADT